MRFSQVPALFAATFQSWNAHKAQRMGAALAYFTVFSLSPLLILAIALGGALLGHDAVQGRIVGSLQGLLGEAGARAIQDMLAAAHRSGHGGLSSAIGVTTLLVGASGVFGELQDALNTIWEVKPRRGSPIGVFLKTRLLSMAVMLSTSFLLVVSLIFSTVVAAVGALLRDRMPGGESLWQIAQMLLSFVSLAYMFMLLFKLVPDVTLRWRDVYLGGVVTALLFTLGELAIGLYLGKRSIGSMYGAAGSFVILLIWVYYNAQIMLFGAEFTRAYTLRHGSGLRVAPIAEPVTREAQRIEGQSEEAPGGPR